MYVFKIFQILKTEIIEKYLSNCLKRQRAVGSKFKKKVLSAATIFMARFKLARYGCRSHQKFDSMSSQSASSGYSKNSLSQKFSR